MLAALVVAIVVGIVGMHALPSHGTPTTPVAASATGGTTAMPEHESAHQSAHQFAHDAALVAGAPHDAHAHSATHTAASTTTGNDPGHDSGHDMASMAMLCVAMLAVGALTVLLLLVVAIRRPLLPTAFAPAPIRTRVLQWVRGTGPPPVWQFSVIRC